jgi:hypothetical protein
MRDWATRPFPGQARSFPISIATCNQGRIPDERLASEVTLGVQMGGKVGQPRTAASGRLSFPAVGSFLSDIRISTKIAALVTAVGLICIGLSVVGAAQLL